MPRPRSLTRAGIAGAALAVLDRDGPAGLTMRAVSGELGTSAMALYRYVRDRVALEQLMVEHLLEPVDLTLPTGTPWQERIVLLMDRVRRAVAAHPAAVPLLLAHRHTSPASLRWIETMLDVLAGAGLAGADRVITQRTLVSYLIGSLHSQARGPLTGPGTATMADLPGSQFPHLTEAARLARAIPPDEEFHRGLATLLSGLGQQLQP